MAGSVLDSYAVLVFLFGQEGHGRVAARLEAAISGHAPLWISAPNWAEVRYMIERKAGADAWLRIRPQLLALPLEVTAADRDLAEAAGALKARRAMSLADCFAAALAQRQQADVYTGDPEFRAVEDVVPIVWL